MDCTLWARFGERPQAVQWLSDNGPPYRATVCSTTNEVGLVPITTLTHSP